MGHGIEHDAHDHSADAWDWTRGHGSNDQWVELWTDAGHKHVELEQYASECYELE